MDFGNTTTITDGEKHEYERLARCQHVDDAVLILNFPDCISAFEFTIEASLSFFIPGFPHQLYNCDGDNCECQLQFLSFPNLTTAH